LLEQEVEVIATVSTVAPDPSKHHYIPEFYLKWWTDTDGRLERYTRPIPRKVVVKRVYPSQVGFEGDLYISPGEPGASRNWLEVRLFQHIDNLVAPVLAKLNSNPVPVLSEAEMSAWSVFIRSLHHRTPQRMLDFRESGHVEWLSALDAAKAEYPRLRGKGDPPTFEEYRSKLSPQLADRLILRVLPTILFSEKIRVFLNDLHKRYFDIPRDLPHLLISDSVLVMTNGLQITGGHYAIPLSPRRLLIAAFEKATIEQATEMKARHLVEKMNTWIVERAQHFVGALDRSQDRFIRNRFGIGVLT
jgi:hypothetical protein